MSRSEQRQRHIYLPTLIDRLQDDAPNRLTERPQEYAFDVRGMRAIVQRDLALLLNTTNLSDQIDEQRFPAAASSVLNYGVPALSGSYVADRKWKEVAALIRKTIVDFEPRLIPASLTVTALHDAKNPSRYNTLMFELNGQVQWSPYPIEFRIRTAFDLENAKVSLQQT